MSNRAEQLVRDSRDEAIQGFAVTPERCYEGVIVPASDSYTLDVATEELLALRFRATGDLNVCVNEQYDTAMTFDGGVQHELLFSHTVITLHFVNSSYTDISLQLWGM